MRNLHRREAMLLGGLLAVLAVAHVARQDSTDRVRDAGEQGSSPQYGAAPVVQMASLGTAAIGYRTDGRNLFGYAARPAVERALSKAPVKPTVPTAIQTPVRPTPPPSLPSHPVSAGQRVAQPPTVPFKYIGFLGPVEERIAVFENSGQIVIASPGEALSEELILREIGFEKAVVGFTDERFTGQTAELPLDRAAARRTSGKAAGRRSRRS